MTPKWPSLTQRFSSFWHTNFWKMMILHKHRQYAYQMKAEIILNSYFLSKSSIVYEMFWKNWNSKFFCLNFWRKKKFDSKVFKKIILQPPNFFLKMILNTKNENYMKVWQSWLCPKSIGEHSNWLNPSFLGLILIKSCFLVH